MTTITCTHCNGVSRVEFPNDRTINYIDQTPIISARKRSDMEWGFECICGNDTRLSKLEVTDPDHKVEIKGSSKEVVEAVIDRMNLSPENSFIMQEV